MSEECNYTEYDALISEAAIAMFQSGDASIYFLQKKFSLGYFRAKRIITMLIDNEILKRDEVNQFQINFLVANPSELNFSLCNLKEIKHDYL